MGECTRCGDFICEACQSSAAVRAATNKQSELHFPAPQQSAAVMGLNSRLLGLAVHVNGARIDGAVSASVISDVDGLVRVTVVFRPEQAFLLAGDSEDALDESY